MKEIESIWITSQKERKKQMNKLKEKEQVYSQRK